MASCRPCRPSGGSLATRMVLFAMAAGIVLIVILLVVVTARIRDDVFEDRREVILADARLRAATAQAAFDTSGATTVDEVWPRRRGGRSRLHRVDLLLRGGCVGPHPETERHRDDDKVINDLTTDARLRLPRLPERLTESIAQGERAPPSTGSRWRYPTTRGHQSGAHRRDPGDHCRWPGSTTSTSSTAWPASSASSTWPRATSPLGGWASWPSSSSWCGPSPGGCSSPCGTPPGPLSGWPPDCWPSGLRVQGEDEISTLASSFNHMATSLEDQIERLESLSKVQRLFVSDVSHELRTPLASIRLARSRSRTRARRSPIPSPLRSSRSCPARVDRFETMLTDLLDISRIDSGNVQLRLEEFDLAQVVDTGCARPAPVPLRRHRHRAAPPPPASAGHRGDRFHAGRAHLRNLVVNALEHGEGTRMDVTVAVDRRRGGGAGARPRRRHEPRRRQARSSTASTAPTPRASAPWAGRGWVCPSRWRTPPCTAGTSSPGDGRRTAPPSC